MIILDTDRCQGAHRPIPCSTRVDQWLCSCLDQPKLNHHEPLIAINSEEIDSPALDLEFDSRAVAGLVDAQTGLDARWVLGQEIAKICLGSELLLRLLGIPVRFFGKLWPASGQKVLILLLDP